jgi:hypothetical protein
MRQCLKVPKREIFDRSDFPDFYTIKPLRVGDFGVGTSYLDELLQLQVKFCWSISPPPPTYKLSAGYMSKTTDSTQ